MKCLVCVPPAGQSCEHGYAVAEYEVMHACVLASVCERMAQAGGGAHTLRPVVKVLAQGSWEREGRLGL